MRDLIRKILKEETEGVKQIKDNYKKVEKNLPKILKLIKVMLKGHYDDIKVGKKNVFYGSDNYISESFLISIYNSDGNFPLTIRALFNSIRDFVGIDPSEYGVPLDIQFVNTKTLKESNREILRMRRRVDEIEEELTELMRRIYVRKSPCEYTKEAWQRTVFSNFFEDFDYYAKIHGMSTKDAKELKDFLVEKFNGFVEDFWKTRCDKNSTQENEQV